MKIFSKCAYCNEFIPKSMQHCTQVTTACVVGILTSFGVVIFPMLTFKAPLAICRVGIVLFNLIPYRIRINLK